MQRTTAGRVGVGAAAALLSSSAALVAPAPASATSAPANGSSSPSQMRAEHQDVDLRDGAVFTMSNAKSGNRVVAFDRVDGKLRRVGSFATGGRGSGGFEDTANGLVLGSAAGESAPNNLISESRLLFATNAGSNTVSVFQVLRDRLRLVEVQGSRGEKPVSVTVNDGLVYVLNSGEVKDGLPTPPNCTTGHRPTVTGFRVSAGGRLTPIPHSTRRLSGDPFSGCAQVSFSPGGRHLVATERLAVTPGETPDDEGRINVYDVRRDGRLGRHRVVDATGQGPFGFTFTKSGTLLTSEQFDGPDGPGRGAAAAYRVNRDGSLKRTSRSVHNGGTDSCWFVVTDDGKHGFVTSFFGGGRISSYHIGADGSLRLDRARAATQGLEQGASDLSLSGDSRYLYQLNSFTGKINEFRVDGGRLTLVQTVRAHPASMTAAPVGLASS